MHPLQFAEFFCMEKKKIPEEEIPKHHTITQICTQIIEKQHQNPKFHKISIRLQSKK